jgi:hypothetical protein
MPMMGPVLHFCMMVVFSSINWKKRGENRIWDLRRKKIPYILGFNRLKGTGTKNIKLSIWGKKVLG